MTNTEGIIWIAVEVGMALVVATAAWLCFRRTRAAGFMALALLLFLWPIASGIADMLHQEAIRQLLEGQRPSLFPFSLIKPPGPVMPPGAMSIGEFNAKFDAVRGYLGTGLIALCLLWIARDFRKRKHRDVRT